MRFEPALLEEWMRRYYFATDADIGSSGVREISVGELRALLEISVDDFDGVVLRDGSSQGSRELRDAIARRWGNGESEWVMATHGASEAIYLVLNTLLEPGDEVVALEPTYHSHTSIARSLGCRIRPWRLRAECRFEPDLAELERLVGKKTRVIIVNFPHNPTGATVSVRQQADLVAIAADASAYLLWDGAFAELVHGGEPLPDPTSVYDRAISVGTLSKAYGLPGLRFGWCVAHPQVLRQTIKLRDRMTLHLSPLVELLATRVACDADILLGDHLRLVERNLRVLTSWADVHRDYLDLVPPRGGVTAFPRLVDCADTEPLCRELARQDSVLLVPGSCFGHRDRVRLGFGARTDQLRHGLGALERRLRDAGTLPTGAKCIA